MKALPMAILLALLSSILYASCPSLEIGVIANATISQGGVANYPLVVKNIGIYPANVYLSAANDYLPQIDAYFDVSYDALSQNEETVFNFYVSTASAEVGTYEFPVEISSDSAGIQCSENLLLNAEVTPSASEAVQEGRVNAEIYPTSLKQLLPGEKMEYFISIYNNLNEEIFASIAAPSNPLGKSVSIAESDFRISPNDAKVVKAYVILPAGTPSGDYEVVFRVRTTSACCVQEFLLPVKVRSYYKEAQLALLNEPLQCIEVKHGERKVLQLGVRNYGEIEKPFSLEIVGNDDSTEPVRLPLRNFELKSGEREYFNLTILPRDTMPIDYYHFRLQAKYLGFVLIDKEICYRVQGTSNVKIEKPIYPAVKRCTTAGFEVKVTNMGTLEDDYAIETKPLVKANAYAEPDEFTLSPRESETFNFIVQTSCITPLGGQLASFVLRPRKCAAETSTFEFSVVSSNKSEESFLKIDFPASVNAVVGEQKKLVVNVLNAKSEDMENTEVTIDGIPSSWVSLDNAKTIKTGKTAPFRLVLTPKAAGKYNINVVASSGLEISKFSSVLQVVGKSKQISANSAIEEVYEGDVVKEAIV
ncbi:MAG: hypothetical protein V1658_01335, partial [Candidatus Micrarchaeota archaeon]